MTFLCDAFLSSCNVHFHICLYTAPETDVQSGPDSPTWTIISGKDVGSSTLGKSKDACLLGKKSIDVPLSTSIEKQWSPGI